MTEPSSGTDAQAGDPLGQAWYRDRRGPADFEPAAAGPREPGRIVLGRLAVRVVLGLALVAAADLAVRAAFPPAALLPWMEREFAAYTVKVERFEEAPAPDVLFLGNSRVHDGIVPEVVAQALAERWGRPARVFNLGLMNATAAEYAALVRGHLPDPPPPRIILGISGTEFVNVHEFQYASRFLWDAAEFGDWIERTPLAQLDREHVSNYLASAIGSAWYTYAERDALRAAAMVRLRDLLGMHEAPSLAAVRAQIGRYNQRDALSPDGTSQDEGPQPNLARLLENGQKVRIPPYSKGDFSELVRSSDFPLMREVCSELAARGCRVALVEVPPSPWLQEQAPEFHGELFRQRMGEFAGSLGLPFVPMRPTDTFLDDAAYVDANHLTTSASRRFSSIVVQRLAETGFFDT